ncbi:hypothetical protein [Oligella sp. HMSC09E12]|uniref:hypothetical protein n=1 Tax=Oligella sp. HMSC09E12 TaxID=1581147 RepID=UPI0008A24E15|nr:hypothetical protein [Oligella sp. HMSC09E12]OFV50045.1 hypothetical protein HMPREF3179_03005 [Oligella sp. HMSC09E12]
MPGLLDDFKLSDVGGGLSRTAVIEPLGFPVDAVTYGLNRAIDGINYANQSFDLFNGELPSLGRPVLGSDWIADQFRKVGWQDNLGSSGDIIGGLSSLALPFGATKAKSLFGFSKDLFERYQRRSNLSSKDIKNIRKGLLDISNGENNKYVRLKDAMTPQQFDSLVTQRKAMDASYPFKNNFIIDLDHIYDTRVLRDGYNIDDVMKQVKSATSRKSEVFVDPARKQNNLINPYGRDDGYGNVVKDRIGIDLRGVPQYRTVIPKGDTVMPTKKRKPR